MLALFIAWQVYPYVNQFLLNSFVYDFVYHSVEANLGLDEMVAERSADAQDALISSLPLPAFLISILQSGNNPVLYELFKATNLAEYIYAYLTVIFVNMLSVILGFIIISIIMRVILKSLHIVTRLPVIHTLNRFGGVAAGAVQGLFVVWIAGLIITGLIAMGIAPWLGESLESSAFAKRFVDANFLVDIITNLTNSQI
jgi:hypothetical protein